MASHTSHQSHSSHPAITRRRLAKWFVVLIVAAVTARTAFLRGLFTPIRIAGGSMAETFLGDHFALDCPDCRFTFRCDADSAPADGRVVCPNCGYAKITLDNLKPRRGERVFVDRWPALTTGPRRWDVVAVRTPGKTDHLSIKRIMGLPGEAVAIRDGDIYINGQLLHKSPDRQRELAVLVHNDTRRPAGAKLPARWQPQQADSHWRTADDDYLFEPESRDDSSDSSPALDWLTYRHWRCFANPFPRSDESPILDNDPYNQNEARELNDVADLLLRCRVTSYAPAEIAFVCNNGWETVAVTIATQRREAALKISGQIVARQSLPDIADREIPCEFAVCDRRVYFLLDGRTLFDHAYERTATLFQPTPRPFALGAAGGRVAVRALKIYRDIHHLDPLGLARDWSLSAPLAADEIFVLGDNPPISTDSRHWEPRLKTNAIVGRVVRF